MIRARLIVHYQTELDDNGEPKRENWGEFDFVALPRVGEHVHAYFNRESQTVITRSIEHWALEHPVAHPEMQTWGKEPSVNIIADWHWSD